MYADDTGCIASGDGLRGGGEDDLDNSCRGNSFLLSSVGPALAWVFGGGKGWNAGGVILLVEACRIGAS